MQEIPIRDAWQHINLIDWHKPDFQINKAYVCALFSELAYYRIAQFEFNDARRVSVIPCLAYQRNIREGRTFDFDEALRSLDFGEYFVVIRRYAIIVGVRTRKVIFVAIRGTKYLYDWFTNLCAARYSHGSVGETVYFHMGFFRAMYACLGPVTRELGHFIDTSEESIPIYVTGHSLGGAMAAIMHAIWHGRFSGQSVSAGIPARIVRTEAAYTFGMPRYGDLKAITTLREPYHVYNEMDIVPTVPPKWLGFESCASEFMLDGTSIENIQNRESIKFFSWVYRLASGRGINEHSVELYRERLSRSV